MEFRQRLCVCWAKKRENSTQDNEVYGEIPSEEGTNLELFKVNRAAKRSSKICAFIRRKRRSRNFTSANPVSSNGENPTQQNISKLPSQPAPPIPSTSMRKKVSWANRNHKQSLTGHSYDYIDAAEEDGGSTSDPFYSKVDSQRYDYPTFSNRERLRRPIPTNSDEPFYTSASQIYSALGSEDPYSSIASADRAGGTYDESSSFYDTAGYARIKNNHKSTRNGRVVTGDSATESSQTLDTLYAKITRPSNLQNSQNQPSTSATVFSKSLPAPPGLENARSRLSRTFEEFPRDTSQLQLEESGSGSVATSGSAPSYRYLTVRESVDVIRERIRQREDFLNGNISNENGSNLPNGRVEHYYSTIANEYESLGGDSLYGGSLTQSQTAGPSNRRQIDTMLTNGTDDYPTLPSASASLSISVSQPGPSNSKISPTRINGTSIPFIVPPKPPKPPTSPIPLRTLDPPIIRPVVLSLPPSKVPDLSVSSSIFANVKIPNGYRNFNSNPNLALSTKSNVALNAQQHRNSQNFDHQSSQKLFKHPETAQSARLQQNTNSSIINQWPQKPVTLAKQEVVDEITDNSPLALLERGSGAKTTSDAETQTQRSSRIPVSLSSRVASSSFRSRTPSPSSDLAMQTIETLDRISARVQSPPPQPQNEPPSTARKKKAPPLPPLVGSDYISPVDLGSARGWPLRDSSLESFGTDK